MGVAWGSGGKGEDEEGRNEGEENVDVFIRFFLSFFLFFVQTWVSRISVSLCTITSDLTAWKRWNIEGGGRWMFVFVFVYFFGSQWPRTNVLAFMV